MANIADNPKPDECIIVQNDIEWEIKRESIDWEEDDVVHLPEGLKVKIVFEDREAGRVDMFTNFPPGYIEPEHTHESTHATLILDGTMLIHGYELGCGDYVLGPGGVRHGPMVYPEPDGCLVWSSSFGGSFSHDWDEDPNR